MSAAPSPLPPVRLLLVDDDAHVTELFAEVVRVRLGWQVVAVGSPAEVSAELIAAGGFDVAVVDVSFGLGGGDGLGVLRALHAAWLHTRLVVATDGDAWVDELVVEARVTLPLAGVLHKTASVDEQLAVLAALAAPPRHMS